MQYKTMVMFNITESPVAERHIGWNVTRFVDNAFRVMYSLHEIVEASYRHPDAPDNATVQNLLRHRGTAGEDSIQSAPWRVMHATQQVCSMTAKPFGG